MASLEGETPIRQCITILDKKVRNLEKRKVKLDGYRCKVQEGLVLDKDQEEAVSKYELVVQNLDFSKELQKQFQQVNTETEKALRKQAKRDKIERQNSDISRLKEVLRFQGVFECLKNETVREELKFGKWSQVTLSEKQLQMLDDFNSLMNPLRISESSYSQQLCAAAEHLYWLLERSDRPVLEAMTYKDVAVLAESIANSSLFETKLSRDEASSQKEVLPEDSTLSKIQDLDDQVEQQLNGGRDKQQQQPATSNGFKIANVESLEESNVGVTTGSVENRVGPVIENGSGFSRTECEYSQPLQQSTEEFQQTGAIQSQPQTAPQGMILGGRWPVSDPLIQQQHLGANQTLFATPLSSHLTIPYMDESAYDRQRPLRDIVSSVQGSYNFLQESLIENVDNQSNLNNNNSVPDVASVNEAAVSSTSSSASLQQQQMIDHHQLQHEHHQQLPMATVAGSQASGYAGVYHNQLHPHHQLLHHHHNSQTMGMPTSASADVYYQQQQQQQQLFQRVPSNVVYERSGQPPPDLLDTKQLQQISPSISTSTYPTFHSMSLPEQSAADHQMSGFMISSVPPTASSYQQHQSQQIENSKAPYTMNPNADIFHSGFHGTSPGEAGVVSEAQVDQSANGKLVGVEEQKEATSKSFAQTASGGKNYQEFTNSQNQRSQKPMLPHQRFANSSHSRMSFNSRQGAAPPYSGSTSRGGGAPYRGSARFGGPGVVRPAPNSSGNQHFYQRNDHYHTQMST